MTSLPAELIQLIATYCDTPTLLSLASASKGHYALLSRLSFGRFFMRERAPMTQSIVRISTPISNFDVFTVCGLATLGTDIAIVQQNYLENESWVAHVRCVPSGKTLLRGIHSVKHHTTATSTPPSVDSVIQSTIGVPISQVLEVIDKRYRVFLQVRGLISKMRVRCFSLLLS
jgi:hypothetical protein